MLLIIGDSFSSEYALKYWPGYHRLCQTYLEGDKQRSWVTDLIEYYNGRVDVFGYGGKSWWYSWRKAVENYKTRWLDVSAVVFIHTNPSRINNAWNEDLPQVLDSDSSANTVFFKHIIDEEFQQFAQAAYIQEINQQFADVKTIHFFSFGTDGSRGPLAHKINGMVYTTPLMHVAVAGLTGTKDSINAQLRVTHGDRHLVNHLTKRNNAALGKLVIDSLANYQPGQYSIDFDKYGFDIANLHYWKWPDANYGTQ